MANAGNNGRWLVPGLGPLIGLRVAVSRNPWRIGPAWAVVAGALVAGLPMAADAALLRLLGAVLLADSAWGAIWAVMAVGAGEPRPAESWGLPYIQPTAPIMQVSERVRSLASGAGCHDLVVSMVLALGLAALLGSLPLLLTALVVAIAMSAQVVAERGRHPALPYGLLVVALPWTLGMALAGRPLNELPGPLALGIAFTILVWGGERLRGRRPAGVLGVWLGQAAVLAVLVALRLPWAACLAATLFLPPSWWLLTATARRRERRPAMALALEHSAIWWWLILLLAVVALRQIVGS